MIAGRALSDHDTWLIEFEDEFHELCDGQIDTLWLAGLACTLYPPNKDRAPREAAGSHSRRWATNRPTANPRTSSFWRHRRAGLRCTDAYRRAPIAHQVSCLAS